MRGRSGRRRGPRTRSASSRRGRRSSAQSTAAPHTSAIWVSDPLTPGAYSSSRPTPSWLFSSNSSPRPRRSASTMSTRGCRSSCAGRSGPAGRHRPRGRAPGCSGGRGRGARRHTAGDYVPRGHLTHSPLPIGSPTSPRTTTRPPSPDRSAAAPRGATPSERGLPRDPMATHPITPPQRTHDGLQFSLRIRRAIASATSRALRADDRASMRSRSAVDADRL
jgi:hypothetical protein